jgi:hypothetical protein
MPRAVISWLSGMVLEKLGRTERVPATLRPLSELIDEHVSARGPWEGGGSVVVE